MMKVMKKQQQQVVNGYGILIKVHCYKFTRRKGKLTRMI